MAGAIFGDWTHRRADAGGSRALPADLGRARLRAGWTWDAPKDKNIVQVRTAGDFVVVAAMSVASGQAGWDHAMLFLLEGATGKVVAKRMLPDPVPVASVAVEGRALFIVATAPGEPVFTYALSIPDLHPKERGIVAFEDAAGADVLDAWPLPGGGYWLELEARDGSAMYMAVFEGEGEAASRSISNVIVSDSPIVAARDACESARALFVPEGDALYKLADAREGDTEKATASRRTVWARGDTSGISCHTHALAHEGLVYAALAGSDSKDLFAQVVAMDRWANVERYRTPFSRFSSSMGGELARLTCAGDEVAMQMLSNEGVPVSDVLMAGPGGAFAATTLGAKRRFVLDAALGSMLLAHATKADGRVVVALFAVDAKAGLLGRRARMHASAETSDVGAGSAVYAGAGRVLVKGERRVVALDV